MVGLSVIEFSMQKLAEGMMLWIIILKKSQNYGNWKLGSSKEDYLAAKTYAKHAVYNYKKVAQEI